MEHTFEVDIGSKHIIAYSDIYGDKLVPGDMYIAKRNTGWHLGKCGKVCLGPGQGFVQSDPPAAIYSYDCHECFKVKEVNIIGGCGATVYEADSYICPYYSRHDEWISKKGNYGPCGVDLQCGTNRCFYACFELNLE